MDGPFFINISELEKFPLNSVVDAQDRHGGPIRGLVVKVLEGNRVAIIYTEPEEQ